MLTIAPSLRTVFDHDGAIILDIGSDQFFSVNSIGAFIWTRLLEGNDLHQITEALVSETGMDVSIVSADVGNFVADLKSKNLFHLPTLPDSRQNGG